MDPAGERIPREVVRVRVCRRCNAPAPLGRVLTDGVTRRRRSYSERMIHQGARDFLSSNWRVLAGVGLFILLLTGVTVAWYLIVVGGNTGAFLAGFTVGAFAMAAVATVAGLWLIFGDGYTYVVGNEGEKATRQVLGEAAKSGLIFGWVDNIELGESDIDHLAVAPNGVLVIETKYRKGAVWVDNADHWIAQARRNAKTTRRILLSADVKTKQAVRPLVVVWGAADGLEEVGGDNYGEYVIRGADLADWISDRSSGELSQEQGIELVGKVEGFARSHPPKDARREGVTTRAEKRPT